LSTEEKSLFEGTNRTQLEAALPGYVLGRRWFGGKARHVASVQIVEAMPLQDGSDHAYIVLAQVNYSTGEAQKYVLPLAFAVGGTTTTHGPEASIVTQIQTGEGNGAETLTVYDATFDPDFTLGLLAAIKEEQRFRSAGGEIAAWRTDQFSRLRTRTDNELQPSIIGAEQSNTSVRYGDSFILKLFRRLEEGISPELEFGRFLGEKGFANTPPLAGAIEYRGASAGDEPLTLAVLQGFVRNQGDAWSYTLRSLIDYFDRAMSGQVSGEGLVPRDKHLLALAGGSVPSIMQDLTGSYLDSLRVLARRTAQMHLALGGGTSDKAFDPEPYTPDYQRAFYRSSIALTEQAFGLLRDRMSDLPEETRREADALLNKQADVAARFQPFQERIISAITTRCHGDYHLGQVLYTGSDFMIIDFEGEPVRSLAERRAKHSPLKDVAGMLRSFHYAAFSGMFDYVSRHKVSDQETLEGAEGWAMTWPKWISAMFLATYLETAGGAAILPQGRDDLQVVLNAHLLEKAVYELVYELNNRPGWVRIPLSGIAQLVQ
jgi:trehalose synthase-fused probable maltokinase